MWIKAAQGGGWREKTMIHAGLVLVASSAQW